MEISYLEQIVKKIVVPSVIIIIKRQKKRLYKRHVKMRPKVVLDNLKSFLERLYHPHRYSGWQSKKHFKRKGP